MDNINPLDQAKKLAEELKRKGLEEKTVKEKESVTKLYEINRDEEIQNEQYLYGKEEKIKSRDSIKNQHLNADKSIDELRKNRNLAVKEILSVNGGWESIRRDYDKFQEIFGPSSKEIKRLKILRREGPKEEESLQSELENFTKENLQQAQELLESLKSEFGEYELEQSQEKVRVFEGSKKSYEEVYLPQLEKFLEEKSDFLDDEISWEEGKYGGYHGVYDMTLDEKIKDIDTKTNQAENAYEQADRELKEIKDKGKGFWQKQSSYDNDVLEIQVKSKKAHDYYNELWSKKRILDQTKYDFTTNRFLDRNLLGAYSFTINQLTAHDIIKENPGITIRQFVNKVKDVIEGPIFAKLKPTEKEVLLAKIFSRLKDRIRLMQTRPYY